jgi:ribonuclease HI
MSSKTPKVEIFTDGACRGNPGPGGWGALMRFGGVTKKIKGAADHTTNNRMEMMAVIQALSALTRKCDVVITTDSQYVQKGVTEWMAQWKKRNWKTADKKNVKNEDLWRQLDELVQAHHIEWHWVRGHNGHTENELVDELANQAIDEMLAAKTTE